MKKLSKKDLLIGIDIGTSSGKGCIINQFGQMVDSVSVEYSPISPHPDRIEQDPEDWYQALIFLIRKMEQNGTFQKDKLVAIAIAGQMRGLTFVGADNKPVRSSILWNDQRCQEEVDLIQSTNHEMIERITMNPINTMCTLSKLLWVKKHEPESLQATKAFLFPKDYLNLRLTNRICTDRSDASGSSFYDIRKQNWSEEILDYYHLPIHQCPEIVPSTQVIGTVSYKASLETGLPRGLPVVMGGSDSIIEALAIGLYNQKQCKVRLGTSGAFSTIIHQLRDVHQYYCWSYLLPNSWMIDLNTRSCAQSVQWGKNLFYQEALDHQSIYQVMMEEAKLSPIGSRGLFFHPYLLGEDAPYWDPQLRGNLFGLTVTHRRADIIRAIYEGTAFALKDAFTIFGEIAKGFQEYIFVGGGIKNQVWLSIVADVLGIAGKIPAYTDAAFGAAMVAGIGSSIFPNIESAVEKCRQIEKTFHYSLENHRIYQDLYKRYKDISKMVRVASHIN
nr:xylulokinase [Candidatus Atribacteria bacterium]